MPNVYLVCTVGGCSDVDHLKNERNQVFMWRGGKNGTGWRDQRWAISPKCDICGRERKREEVDLLTL